MQLSPLPGMPGVNQKRTTGKEKSRGATMVEFAIISVALFTLIFGIIEGAFAVRARNAVNNAIDDAARAGAVAGASADADWLILNQLVGRGANDASEIQYVTVYRAQNSSDGTDTQECVTNANSPICLCLAGLPQGGLCNVYRAPTLDALDSNRAAFASGALGTQWPATGRSNGGNLGFLGVYVRSNYEPILAQIFYDWRFEVNAQSLQAIETSGEL